MKIRGNGHGSGHRDYAVPRIILKSQQHEYE
jgi:hypothetical protein